MISICCDSDLLTINEDEGTSFYACKQCGQPCDSKPDDRFI